MKTDLNLPPPQINFTQHNANIQRLMYWSGDWVAGTYEANEVVSHNTILWIVKSAVATTTEEPLVGATDWDALARSPTAVATMNIATPPVAGADLGAGWDVMDYFDNSALAFNMSTNITTGELTFEQVGWYEVVFQASLTGHNSVNAGRTINLRAWDVTDAGQVGNNLPIGIGRNTEDTFINVSLWLEVVTANVGDAIRFELGGGDIVTGIDYAAMSIQAKRIL